MGARSLVHHHGGPAEAERWGQRRASPSPKPEMRRTQPLLALVEGRVVAGLEAVDLLDEPRRLRRRAGDGLLPEPPRSSASCERPSRSVAADADAIADELGDDAVPHGAALLGEHGIAGLEARLAGDGDHVARVERQGGLAAGLDDEIVAIDAGHRCRRGG